MRRILALSTLVLLPAPALAVGEDTATPPAMTETTQTCVGGNIWDLHDETCVPAEILTGAGEDDILYAAAREFAYTGHYAYAAKALAAMSDQSEGRVLTYWGFLNRKTGDLKESERFYLAAIDADPDNLLARSYYGIGAAANGDLDTANAQLVEIRNRGGQGSWPYLALKRAIGNGGLAGY